MGAATSKISAKRRSRDGWGPMRWLILGLLALCFAASSGCAHRPTLSELTANAPRINLPETLKADAWCKDELRGRLPEADFLTVGEALAQWQEAEARATCQGARADGLIDVIDAHNAAWEAWLARR
jgi:hypothetical protein